MNLQNKQKCILYVQYAIYKFQLQDITMVTGIYK